MKECIINAKDIINSINHSKAESDNAHTFIKKKNHSHAMLLFYSDLS